MNEPKNHHPWCNWFTLPPEGCKMCEGLYRKYPMSPTDTADDLLERHFPDAVKVG